MGNKRAKRPNDKLFLDQWHLNNRGKHGGLKGEDIGALSAWSVQHKSPNVIVAVIDGGVDIRHPDLKNNIWKNNQEIPGNGIDDDENGYIDDVNGWDFVDNNGKLKPDDHGTHVAGIIGAEGNNKIGGTGVTWDTQLMSLDIFSGQKSVVNENVWDAIYYAVDNGADVINMSIGYTVPFGNLSKYKELDPNSYKAYLDAFKYAVSNGVTIVSAAGNFDSDDQKTLSLPAAYGSIIPGFITVAALDNYGYLTNYSNYGSKVTIAAPGGSSLEDWCGTGACSEGAQIISTVTGKKKYGGMPGTSMAAPVVSGSAALMVAANNALSPSDIEEIMLISGRNSYDYDSYVLHGKELDLANGIRLASKWKKSKIKKFNLSPERSFYSGSSGNDQFYFGKDVSGNSSSWPKIDSFGYEKWQNELDYLIFSEDILTNESSNQVHFESILTSNQIDQAKTSDTTFVYHRPSGYFYLNSNGSEPGWSSSNSDSPFLELIGGPELIAENLRIVIDEHEYRIPTIVDNSGATVPYSIHADEHTANHLFEASGRDSIINYFIDKNGSYGKHKAMPKGSLKYIKDTLGAIDDNTSIVFKKSSLKKANLVLGTVSKYKHAHYQYEDWGGSSAWINDSKKRKNKMKVSDQIGVSQQIGNALGLILSGKSEGVYDFSDSIMAYDNDYENFNGFTTTDFITIDKMWSSLGS